VRPGTPSLLSWVVFTTSLGTRMSVPSGLPTLSPSGTKQISSLDSIFGPLLIGVIVSTALWGVTCAQTYDYFMSTVKDRLPLRLVIAVLLIIDTFETAINIHAVYFYLVTNFGNAAVLLRPSWTITCRPAVVALSRFIVHAMFARRSYLLSRSRKNTIITSWIVAISAADLVMCILVSAKLIKAVTAQVLNSLRHISYITFCFGLASDIGTTFALCWILHSSRTGIRRTDSLVNVLMFYILTTGVLVSIVSIIVVIFYSIRPDNLVYLGFHLVLSKLYVILYLSSLNVRENLRSKVHTDITIDLSQRLAQNQQTTATAEDNKSSHHPDGATAIMLRTSSVRGTDHQEVTNSSSSDVV